MKTFYLLCSDLDVARPLLRFSYCKRSNMRIIHSRFRKYYIELKEDPKGKFCWLMYNRWDRVFYK